MSNAADVGRFLARFRRFGAEPSVATYLDLFHPDATLFDSGMPRPLRVAEIPEHIEGVLRLVPDFRMTPERQRFRQPTIFVEAHNQATLAGAPIEWPSIYCIDLKGDQVIRGRRYYDRQPLFARLSPDVAKRPAFEPGVAASGGRMPATPLSFDALRRRAPDLVPRLLCWAGDLDLVFREWELVGTHGGCALRFGLAERFDLRDGLVIAAKGYFDTLVLPPS